VLLLAKLMVSSEEVTATLISREPTGGFLGCVGGGGPLGRWVIVACCPSPLHNCRCHEWPAHPQEQPGPHCMLFLSAVFPCSSALQLQVP